MDSREKSAINIVFFGFKGTPDLTFVEIENDDGESIRIGEWSVRPDGFYVLRIPYPATGEDVFN